MPKTTFLNLSDEKRHAIIKILKEEFMTHPLPDATVKHIVDRLDIARGSFYQYFEDLTESYFYVLEQELSEMHTLFWDLFEEHSRNIGSTLYAYGDALVKELFQEGRYELYKNRYLYWNASLERDWRNYLGKNRDENAAGEEMYKNETVQFLKAIVHGMIQRMFLESWDADTFLSHYRTQTGWILHGIPSTTGRRKKDVSLNGTAV